MTHLFKGQRVYKYISVLIFQVGILISPFSLLPCYFHCSCHGQAEPCNSLLLITILWNCCIDNTLLGSLETFLTSYAKNKLIAFIFFWFFPCLFASVHILLLGHKFILFSLKLNQLQLPNKSSSKENNSTGFDTTKRIFLDLSALITWKPTLLCMMEFTVSELFKKQCRWDWQDVPCCKSK